MFFFDLFFFFFKQKTAYEMSLRDWSSDVCSSDLEDFIQELPPAYRDVIWMVDVEEMKPADVAETLEISLAALKSRLHRARLAVRERLAEVASARNPAGAAEGERRAAP